MKITKIASVAVSASLIAVGAFALTGCTSNNTSETGTGATSSATNAATQNSTNASSSATELANTLSYIIEEEKLAYDVYTVLGEQWNLRTMQNITNSEATHQSQVESLLATYDITDPRSSGVGVFTNPELQKLYDDLIAQGSVSAAAAIQVGITIEKTDIADIDEMLALNLPSDVDAVLENLRAGSENHLAAFERQA